MRASGRHALHGLRARPFVLLSLHAELLRQPAQQRVEGELVHSHELHHRKSERTCRLMSSELTSGPANGAAATSPNAPARTG